MQRTKIDWPNLDYTWNPITGCKRGCHYCYARRIHERFNKTPFTDIVFHKDRINDPLKVKKPSIIFVGSMSDIEYWDKAIVGAVLTKCELCPQHTFMFLSKNPESYMGYSWPKNTMQGLTITKCTTTNECKNLQYILQFPRPFLSIEPLLGEVKDFPDSRKWERIIVGAMTGPKAVKPKYEWIQSIQSILENMPKEKIYLKENIKKYLNKQS